MSGITAQAVKALRERTGAGMMDCKKALSETSGDVDKAIEVLRERGLAKAVKRSGRETTEGTIATGGKGSSGAILEVGCETDFVAKTPDFQKLASSLAETAAAHPEAADVDAVLALEMDGQPIAEHIQSAGGTLGENVQLKRVDRLVVDGAGHIGSYVHAGGRLGVLVALKTEATGDAVGALAKDLAMHVAAADPSPVAVDRDGVDKALVENEADLFRKQALQEGKPEKVVEKIVEGRIRKFYGEICLIEQPFVKDSDKTVSQLLSEAGDQLGNPVEVAGFVRYRLGDS